MRRFATLLALPFLLVACGGDDGLLNPGADGGGQAQILIGRDAGVSGSIGASMLARSGGPVDFSQIASLELVIVRVEAHRIGGGAWTSLSIEPVTVDLAALAATPVTVAAGGLPAGEYNQVRFFLSMATITFLEDITIGSETFLAGQIYDLEIPSVENNGLRVTTAHFTVDGGTETVLLLFDPASTTASIGAAGNGVVRMSPVLHEADEATEAEAEDTAGDTEEDGGSDARSDGSGSGSASVLIGSPVGLSASFASNGFDRESFAASMLPPGGNVSAADIASLRLVLCEVRVIRTGGGDESPEEAPADESDGDAEADEAPACQGNAGGAAWTRIPLEATEIDLFALQEGEVVEIAFGELPAGRYRNVRLYLSEAWITFANAVTIGTRSYAADVELPLRIPGAANSGIKIPSSHFDVVADAEEAIVLIFDETSISSVRATGQGIQMSPVLREAAQAVEEDLTEGSGQAGSG